MKKAHPLYWYSSLKSATFLSSLGQFQHKIWCSLEVLKTFLIGRLIVPIFFLLQKRGRTPGTGGKVSVNLDNKRVFRDFGEADRTRRNTLT